jgi:hypothetical protein
MKTRPEIDPRAPQRIIQLRQITRVHPAPARSSTSRALSLSGSKNLLSCGCGRWGDEGGLVPCVGGWRIVRPVRVVAIWPGCAENRKKKGQRFDNSVKVA